MTVTPTEPHPFDTAAPPAWGAAVTRASGIITAPRRTNWRNSHRAREWDTRMGAINLAILKLRSGSYFPIG